MSPEAYQPHAIEEGVIERHVYPRRVAGSPRPFRTQRRGVRQRRINPALDEFRLASAVHLPLFPLKATQTMANPAVQGSQPLRRLAKAKIAYPPPEVRIQGGDELLQTSPLVTSRPRFDSRFEPCQGFGSNLAPVGGSTPGKAEPQKTAVVRVVHGALARLHLQLETSGD